MKSVYCAVRTGSLNKAVCASSSTPNLNKFYLSTRISKISMNVCHVDLCIVLFYRGADKSLARPGKKQATATKLWLFQDTQKIFRKLSVQPGIRGSNDLRVRRKMATFQLFFFSRVGLRIYQHPCKYVSVNCVTAYVLWFSWFQFCIRAIWITLLKNTISNTVILLYSFYTIFVIWLMPDDRWKQI